MDRNEAIEAIRAALKKRSDRAWSVRGGTGTAWGWITISAPPRRCDEYGRMSDEDVEELARLLGTGLSRQGASIPADSNYRREYVDRASGIEPTVIGRPYWD